MRNKPDMLQFNNKLWSFLIIPSIFLCILISNLQGNVYGDTDISLLGRIVWWYELQTLVSARVNSEDASAFVCVKAEDRCEEVDKTREERGWAWLARCQHYRQRVCAYILAVHTVFGIPSGNENRNFLLCAWYLDRKISQRVSAEFDFYWKQIIETERQKYNITINHETHILLNVVYCGSSLLVTSPTVQWLQASVTQ